MNIRTLLTCSLFLANAGLPVAFSQGSDTCATAMPISGTGTFAFDNSAASLDGVPDSLCYFFGTADIENDVWFSWTAPADGLYTLSTCSQTTMDSKVAVHDGGCAASVLACNDDACGLQSMVDFSAVSGSIYTIRLGNFPGAAGSVGTFSISDHLPILNPANGHYYLAVADQGILWNDAKTAAEAISFQGAPGHLATVNDASENSFILANMSVAGAVASEELWLGGFQDLQAPGYSEPSGGWTWVTGEAWAYENWALSEPNNAPAPEDFLIYMPASNPGEWNDAREDHWNIRGYIVEFDGGGTLGTNYCFSIANSTGQQAFISASGQDSVAANNVTLEAVNLPHNQPGIFYYGPVQITLSFGNGFRCIGAGSTGIARLPVLNSGASGVMQYTLDLTNPPTTATQILGGSTWNFQNWYRDPQGGGSFFNLTDGLEISFTP